MADTEAHNLRADPLAFLAARFKLVTDSEGSRAYICKCGASVVFHKDSDNEYPSIDWLADHSSHANPMRFGPEDAIHNPWIPGPVQFKPPSENLLFPVQKALDDRSLLAIMSAILIPAMQPMAANESLGDFHKLAVQAAADLLETVDDELQAESEAAHAARGSSAPKGRMES